MNSRAASSAGAECRSLENYVSARSPRRSTGGLHRGQIESSIVSIILAIFSPIIQTSRRSCFTRDKGVGRGHEGVTFKRTSLDRDREYRNGLDIEFMLATSKRYLLSMH